MADGGKGSLPRPFSVTQDEFGDNMERIFGARRRRYCIGTCEKCGVLLFTGDEDTHECKTAEELGTD